jgi:hypothetical protein
VYADYVGSAAFANNHLVNVANLRLPAGTYWVVATMNAANSDRSGGDQNITCSLAVNYDDSQSGVLDTVASRSHSDTDATSNWSLPMTLQTDVVYTQPGWAVVTSGSPSGFVDDLRLSAIAVSARHDSSG